ncbi:MAG: TOBE domain-containing protein, partial [Beijerinckiaceae bacterium]
GVRLDAGGEITVEGVNDSGVVGAAVELGVRPEHITLATDGAGDATMAVNFAEQLGSESYLHGALSSGEALTVRLPGQSHVKRGEMAALVLGGRGARHLFAADTGAALIN